VRITRHEIIKYLTDRPGQVVYRKDIADATGHSESQVASSLLRSQRESPIGSEIQTIVAGNAWRYVPNRSTLVSTADQNANKSRSLISVLREYFAQRSGEAITVDELVAYTGRTEAQVKVGVNNARSNHPSFRRHLETIVSGNMWRYNGPADEPTSRPVPTPPETPVAPKPTAQSTSTDDNDDDSARLFEEVGTIDNQLVIRDSDGALYRAIPLT
jgi:hypothetical protein